MSLSTYNPSQPYSVMGLTAGMSFFNAAWGYMEFPKNSAGEIPPNEPKMQGLHPREAALKELLKPSRLDRIGCATANALCPTAENPDEYFSLDPNDKREKFLFLSGDWEYQDSLNPGYVLSLLKKINQKYDGKYRVVDSLKEVCKEIEQASKLGKLTNVLIELQHSLNRTALHFSVTNSVTVEPHQNSEYFRCFQGLDKLGQITLISSEAGAPTNGDHYKNIAQRLATATKRSVIAPTEALMLESRKIAESDHFEPTHYSYGCILTRCIRNFFGPANIFRLFHPKYTQCGEVKENEIHAREKAALEVIRDTSLKNSTLIQSTDFDYWKHVLNFCSDDPKKKLLYLSFDNDHNGGLDPRKHAKFLALLSKNYDMKYEVVYIEKHICNAFSEAAKAGEFAEVIINAHGNPHAMCLIGKGEKCILWFHKDGDLKNCLKGLSESGKITLISCKTGESLPHEDNMATTMAKACKKTVIAAKDLSYPNKIEMLLADPLEIFHADKDDPQRNIYEAFKG